MNIELDKNLSDIYGGLVCPYCGKNSDLSTEEDVYGKKYGKYNRHVYICWPCYALVGCHGRTTKSKGRLANKKLRKLKIETHNAFDRLWRENIMSRIAAYALLSEYLGIPKKYTHIGYFGEDNCLKTIEFSNEVYNKYKKIKEKQKK